jgi:kynurenine formamidase
MATYDLSRTVESGMQTYPGDPAVRLEPHAELTSDGCRVTVLSLGSHTGTHVDAPSHTEAEGRALGSYPLDTFRFDAQVADVRRGAREPIGVTDLPDPTEADILVFRTGWDDHWGTERYLDHPYLAREAAEWCVAHDYHVATDALSVDPTPSPNARATSTGLDAHHALLGAGCLIYENLTGLDAVPSRFRLHAYPLSLDADGSPVRAVAVTGE